MIKKAETKSYFYFITCATALLGKLWWERFGGEVGCTYKDRL
jgi:hypothetical protein